MTAVKTQTLAEFLLERVAEDEAWVRSHNPSERAGWRARADKAILKFCAETRALVEKCSDGDMTTPAEHRALCERALGYTDHEDYREEWRP